MEKKTLSLIFLVFQAFGNGAVIEIVMMGNSLVKKRTIDDTGTFRP